MEKETLVNDFFYDLNLSFFSRSLVILNGMIYATAWQWHLSYHAVGSHTKNMRHRTLVINY